MKRKRILLILLAAGVLAGVAVELGRAGVLGGRRQPSNVLTLYGNVDVRQVELGFRVPGRVKSMAYEEGQTVATGSVMAELDARALGNQLRAAQAAVDVQQATLTKLLAGSRPAEIARAHATVEEARAAQENAHTELQRAEKLLASSAVPRASYDNAAAASRQADARLAAAQESLRLLVQGSRREDIAAERAALEVAQANVASAQTALDDARLVAPSNGVVISRVREPGAIVSPNDVVYVLSLTDSVWVRAYVSEEQLGHVHPGMTAAVLTDAAPERPFPGHVGFISPTAEFTPKSVETPELRTALVYRMRVVVDRPSPTLRQGMPVTVKIDTSGT